MLTGIKKGKRKRKEGTEAGQPIQVTSSASSSNQNRAAADELRRLLSGTNNTTASPTIAMSSSDNVIFSNSERPHVFERLEKRGKIAQVKKEDEEATVLITNTNFSGSAPSMKKEDFRKGARKGKLKKGQSVEGMTISQMVAEEKVSKQQGEISMDEQFARNLSRLGSRYKGTEFKTVNGSSAGADEDDFTGDNGIDMKMYNSSANRLTDAEAYNREMSRQITRAEKEQSITSKCWWWMESKSFQKHTLLSLGDHVSLVLCPSHLSLVKFQCFLVPVKHSASFAACEDEVWEEIKYFKNSLRNLFRKEDQGVLFCETVLPSKRLWQARMDVIPVPLSVEQDAEIYFKSALTSEAEEWGTHTKTLSTKNKGLRRTVPKGFSYFNVEWDGGGFAQIIENQSFPKDFGADTIAGMMKMDPVRFNRKKKAPDDDRGAVISFLEKWKAFDWTLDLDV